MGLSGYRKWLAGLAALALLLALAGGLGWQALGNWAPDRATYPIQGPYISSADGHVMWPTVARLGADFAYIRASSGAARRDARFAENLSGARGAGLRYGAVLEYSLCAPAEAQAALFVTTVPRDAEALPPVLSLGFAPDCPARPSRSALLSDLNTVLNQIEAHSGKPAVLRIGAPFEQVYAVSAGLARTIWLKRDYLQPDYAAKPWVLWQANHRYHIQGIARPVRWNVVKP